MRGRKSREQSNRIPASVLLRREGRILPTAKSRTALRLGTVAAGVVLLCGTAAAGIASRGVESFNAAVPSPLPREVDTANRNATSHSLTPLAIPHDRITQQSTASTSLGTTTQTSADQLPNTGQRRAVDPTHNASSRPSSTQQSRTTPPPNSTSTSTPSRTSSPRSTTPTPPPASTTPHQEGLLGGLLNPLLRLLFN